MSKAVAVKYPAGFRGILKTTTKEEDQEEIWLPTDGRLVAVNANGDIEMGSLVCDLDDQNQVDPDRVARLQSAFRVIKYPFGEPNCAIAFQLGPTGLEDTEGGYFIDRNIVDFGGGNTAILGDQKAIGQGSYFEGGPFDCGTGKCKHNRGTDDDGYPISSLHLSTKALFRKNDTEDGPLKFEGPLAPPNKDLDTRLDCHLSWDDAAQRWYWWTTSAFYPVPTPTPTPTPRPRPSGGEFVPGFTTQPAPVPTPGGTGKAGGDVSRPGVPSIDPRISGTSLTGALFRMVASLSPVMAPAFIYRPQNYTSNQLDQGIFSDPTDKSKEKANQAPVTGACSSFGAQGGTIPGSGSVSSTQTGGESDPWVFNQQPRGANKSGKVTSKYLGGTANGGIVYHPPETDLRDVGSGMAPAGVTLSTMYVLCAPGAYFGCGVPQLVNGAIKDGYSWGVESSTGDLVFRSHSSSGAPSEAIRFTKTAQNIQWMSGQGVAGILDHANSGNRTYTFPDVSCKILNDQGNVGFFGNSLSSKQTVSGAKGGNAALGSLLNALSVYGLINDTTTA